VVFAKCMEVGGSTIALVPLIVHQGETNSVGCHVGLSDVVILVVLQWIVNGSFGRGERDWKEEGDGKLPGGFLYIHTIICG